MQIFRSFFPQSISLVGLLLFVKPVFAQGAEATNSVYLISVLLIIGALILLSAIIALSENFISIESKKIGIPLQPKTQGLGSFTSLWAGKPPKYTGGKEVKTLAQGYNILLKGSPAKTIVDGKSKRFAVRPQNFRGLSPIPKVVVNEGDNVKAGDVLFYDKKNTAVKYVSPVSGEVLEIKRGAKRAISEVIVLGDKEISYKNFDPPSISESSREDIVEFLLESGGWTLLNQRPHDVLPSVDIIPENIFISTFDTAPLSADNNIVVKDKGVFFQKGLDVLNRLTTGKVYLGLDANNENAPDEAFTNAEGVEKNWFTGKHPSGNVGVQIHHVSPIKSKSKVWTLGVQEVITLGELFHKGQFNAERIVAIGGNNVIDPTHVRTYIGANVGELLSDGIKGSNNRIIAGNVLTGRKVSTDDFLDYRTSQLSIVEEGDYYELFGWLLPIKPRPTISKSFPNFLYPNMKFSGDTNMHGEKRAFVMTGEYEKVLPMDLYPQHLMKAILTGDLEQMEGLGIHELTEEDIALCEFVCTSKMPLQEILRDGLDMIREQS